MAMSARALYICAHAPSASATQAGHKTAHHYLGQLRETHVVDVVLIVREEPTQYSAPVNVPESRLAFQLGDRARAIGLVRGMLSRIPPRLATRYSPAAAAQILDMIAENDYSVIWLEFSQVFWLLPLIVRKTTSRALTVLSAHDIQSEVVRRKSRLERFLFLRWTRAYERKLFQMASKIRVQSDKDRHLVQSEAVSADVEVCRPMLSAFAGRVRRAADRIQEHSLLFWGAMNRPENYLAAIEFAHTILPGLQAQFPDTTLFVVGANPDSALQALRSPRVQVTGFLDDPSPYFERASLGIVPLRQGAGIKVKTLEMLEAGLTVISTPIGAEGIGQSDRLVVVEMNQMANAILSQWSPVIPK